MITQWQDFLTTQAAPSSSDSAANRLFDLTHFGLLAVRGADAATFLQGQLTNDIRAVTATQSQLSGCCTQKGRLLARVRVLQISDTFYLQLPAERLLALCKHLKNYVLRSKVTLEDASAELLRIGLAGADTATLLADCGLQLPDAVNALTSNGEVHVIRLAGALPRVEILGDFPAISALWERLDAAQVRFVTADEWRLLDIQAGIPHIYDQTAEAFVPQMINLQLLDGISFRKGCYTGQEVVARMQHIGTLKRQMYRAEVVTDTPPQPGDDLFCAASTSQQASGRVVDAAPIETGRYAVLAVVEISAVTSGEPVRLGENGAVLVLEMTEVNGA
ncbi:folate-binding protein YgfZ [Chromatium okenii]|uniref:CAF17-like 4Fe-4S cluster assembly/insertion protein YgfZ n=1 Tax=Chromatium okenii TaxID=61644 RepID=UPI0026F11662|nr:folate-binding protein [Chromatium okenii]MBV5309120.1 folate-binding protein YgfZ [Chromatium okenii]